MTMNEDPAQRVIARLVADRFIERRDPLAQRILVDEAFRDDVTLRLNACGLRLLDNPFADYIGVGIDSVAESAVFSDADQWRSNNFGLQRDGVALLVLLWALIILPKRERQIAGQTGDAGQSDMFGEARPESSPNAASRGVPETVLLDDYARQLGGKFRVNINLGVLSRVGFIHRRNKVIIEGPLLDLALDYGQLAPRVIEGAMRDLIAARQATAAAAAPADTHSDASIDVATGVATDVADIADIADVAGVALDADESETG